MKPIDTWNMSPRIANDGESVSVRAFYDWHAIGRRASRRGFTLLETLISAAIIGLIAALILGALSVFRESTALDRAVDETMGLLREARQKTLASENGSVWGVHLASSTVSLFQGGCDEACSNSTVQTISWPSSVIIAAGTSLSTSSSQNITFQRLTGAADVVGTILFSSPRSATTKTIQIYASGNVVKQ